MNTTALIGTHIGVTLMGLGFGICIGGLVADRLFKRQSEHDDIDAARYRLLRARVCGIRKEDGTTRFSMELPTPLRTSNIMRGSVAQHFDDAVDAELLTEVHR